MRAICSRTLRALYFIFQLAVARGERGFLCKPYGGQYSNQTSGDQVQCVVTGLAAWRPMASPDERALIDEMTVAFADHQIEVDFDALHGYFAHPRGKWGWEYKDWSDALIFAPLLHLAWNSSGDEKYLAAIRRWYNHCGLEKRAGKAGRRSGESVSRFTGLPNAVPAVADDGIRPAESCPVAKSPAGCFHDLPDRDSGRRNELVFVGV